MTWVQLHWPILPCPPARKDFIMIDIPRPSLAEYQGFAAANRPDLLALHSLDMVWEGPLEEVEPALQAMCTEDVLVAVVTPVAHDDRAIGAEKLKKFEDPADDLLKDYTVITSTRAEFIAYTLEQRQGLKSSQITAQRAERSENGLIKLSFDWDFETMDGNRSTGSFGKCLSVVAPDGRFSECWNCLADIDFSTLSHIRDAWHNSAG